MKVLIKNIEHCINCPHSQFTWATLHSGICCSLVDYRDGEKFGGIPDWCPLPDAEEEP